MSTCNILDNFIQEFIALWRSAKYQPKKVAKGVTGNTRKDNQSARQTLNAHLGNPARANRMRQFGSIFGESQRLIYAQAPVSGIGLVPGRKYLYARSVAFCENAERGIRRISPRKKSDGWTEGCNATKNAVGLNPARASYVLCNLTNNSPLSYHTRDKLGCWIISYRNITALFYRQLIANLSPNVKLSFNRGNPTSLLNSCLTKLCKLFSLFCYPGYDKKLIPGGAKC